MLLTIEQEVEAIWMRKFSIPGLLYLVMRFFTLGYIILDISMTLPIFGPPSVDVRPYGIWFRSSSSTLFLGVCAFTCRSLHKQ